MNKVNQYIKNLGKSVKLASIDVLKEFNPSVSDFVETNAELFKEINYIVRDRKQVLRRINTSIKNSKVYEAADVGIQSIFESIKTGDLYNTARAEAINKRAAGFGDDSEFGDFDFGGDNFDSNFNFDDESDITVGDAYISKSIEGASRVSTEAICDSIITSGKHIVESNRISSHIQMMQNAEAFGKMNGSLNSINANISQMAEIVSVNLTTHANNSKTFYEKSISYQDQSLAYLKELVEMERNRYGKELQEEKKSSRILYSDIVNANGIPDLKLYGKSIKNRAKAKLSESGLDIGNLFGEDSNALLMMAASPLSFIPKKIVEKAIGNTVKNSMDELNKSISSYFGAMILKINTIVKSSDDDENPIFKALKENVLSLFGIENNLKTTFDTSNYNKGQTGWTGTDHKALTEVIPYYLRKILSATTNKEEMVYDFDKGKFIRAREVKDSFKNMRESASKDASSIVREDIEDMVIRDITFTKKEQEDTFKKEMNEYFDYFFTQGIMPDLNRKKSKYDYENLNISDTNFRIISKYLKSLPKSQQMALSKNILEGRSNFSRKIEDLEKQSDSIYSILGNSDSINEFVKFHSKDDSTIVSKGMFENSLLVKDEFGYSIHTYLNRIYGVLLNGIRTYSAEGLPISTTSDTPKLISSTGQPLSHSNYKMDKGVLVPNISDPSYATKKVIEEQNKAKSYEDRQKERSERDRSRGLVKTTYDELDASYDSDDGHIESMLQTNIDINSRKIELEKRSNSTNQKYKNWLDKSKDYYDKHPDEDPSILNRLLRADNVVDKLKIFGDKLSDITKAPGRMISNIIDQVDTRLYESIFGVEDQMYKGKPVKGVLDVMIINIQESFSKLNTWLDENILSPLKKKLDDHGGLTGIINKVLEPFGLNVDDINIFKKGKEYLFGNKDTGQEGLLSPLTNQLKEDLKAVFKYTKDTMKEVYSPIFEGVKDRTPEWMKEKYKEVKNNTSNIIKPVDLEMKKAAEEAGIKIQGNEDALNNIDRHDIGAIRLDKTKLALVHKDEAILPRNKFLNLIRQVIPDGQNMSDEQLYLYYQSHFEKLKSPFLKGNKFKEKRDGSIQEQMTFGERAQRRFDKKGIETGKVTLLDEMVLELSKGITEVGRALFGTSKNNQKVDEDKLNDSFNEAINDLTENYKEYLPKVASSAIIGAGISIIPGIIGGPLLGASVGAGVALLKNSKSLQKYLFGEVAEDGNKTEGLISEDTQKLMKQYLPDMGKYGLAGAVTGLITPFGPMGGLMIGSSLAYLKNNERMREAMFGDEGLINKDRRELLKKALPNIALGTIATLTTGPFGLMGNAALGAGLGLVSTTDSFKEVVFGTKDKDGNYVGGILGGIREGIIEPLKNSAVEIKDNILSFIENDMIKPLTSAIQPIGEEIRHYLEKTITFIPNMLNKVAEKFIGDPIDVWLKEKIFEPAGKLASNFFKMVTKPMKMIVSLPFKTIGALGNSLRQRQIMQGRASYMSASQRLQWRNDHKIRGGLAALQIPGAAGLGFVRDKYKTTDETLADLSLEDTEQILDSLREIKNGSKGLDRETIQLQQKIYRNVNKYFNDKDKLKIPFMHRGARQNILKAINTGDMEEAKKLIRTARSRTGSPLPKEDIEELLAIINDDSIKLTQLHIRRRNIKKLTNEELESRLKPLGLPNLKKNTLDRYTKLFESEFKFKQREKDLEESDSIDNKSNNSIVNNDIIGKEIIDVLKEIRDGIKNVNTTMEGPPKYVEDPKLGLKRVDTNDKNLGYDYTTEQQSKIKEIEKLEEKEREEKSRFFNGFGSLFSPKNNKEEKSSFLDKIFGFVKDHPILSGIGATLATGLFKEFFLEEGSIGRKVFSFLGEKLSYGIDLLVEQAKVYIPIAFAALGDAVEFAKDKLFKMIRGETPGRQDANGNNITDYGLSGAVAKDSILIGRVGLKRALEKSAEKKIKKNLADIASGTVAKNSDDIIKTTTKIAANSTDEMLETLLTKNNKVVTTIMNSIDDIGKKLIEFLAKTNLPKSMLKKMSTVFPGLAKTLVNSKTLLAKAIAKISKGASVVVPVVGAIIGGWNLISGMTDGETARLFKISEDRVTWGMKLISSATKFLLGLGIYGPIFDILNELTSSLYDIDFISYLATELYSLLAPDEGEIALKEAQKQFMEAYEKYKKENNLPDLTADAYNDMVNKTAWQKLSNPNIFGNVNQQQPSSTNNIIVNQQTNRIPTMKAPTKVESNIISSRSRYSNSISITGRGKNNNSNNWRNIKYNNPGDSITQTLGDSGCAPIAGSVFMNELGMNTDPNEAAKFALNGGYKEINGGTDISFFNDYLGAKGINTQSIDINNKNRNHLKATLEKNIPVILLGESNSSDTFGPNGHYVVAHSSINGKVKINDPLNNKGVYETDMSKVINQTNYAVVPSGMGLHSGGFTPSVVDTSKMSKYIEDSGGYYEKRTELLKPNRHNWDDFNDSFYSFVGINRNKRSINSYNNINLDIFKQINGMENKNLTEFRRPTVGALNAWINSYAPSDSPFRGKGSIFLQASDESGLDPKYIIAHAALESGWGKSKIARTKHNYFGVRAYNDSPLESAMYLGTDLKSGIINGAKWIRDNYINKGQNTLYRMLYGDPNHVYAVHDDGKPNDGWMNNIGKIMSHAQQSGLGKNKLIKQNSKKSKSKFGLGKKKSYSGGFVEKVVDMKDVSKLINDYGGYYEKPSELFNINKFNLDDLFTGFKSIFGINDIKENENALFGEEDNIQEANGELDKFFLSKPGFKRMSFDYGKKYIDGRTHRGIDYSGQEGAAIISPISGIVYRTTGHTSYGNVVIVKDSNNHYHYFAHLKYRTPLNIGDSVIAKKTVIGQMGWTGEVIPDGPAGTHLHYEVRGVNNVDLVNPREYYRLNILRRPVNPNIKPVIGFGKSKSLKANSKTGVGKTQIGNKLYKDVINTKIPKVEPPKYNNNKIYSKSGYGLSPITQIQQSTDQLREYIGGSLNDTNNTILLKMIQSIIELLVQIVTNTQSNSEIIKILSEGLSIKIPDDELKNIKSSDNVKQTALNLLKASLLVGGNLGSTSTDNSTKQSSVYANMVKLVSK